MRILIVSGLFPPNAPTATVRPPKFARYLLDRGHDVRVLAAQNLQFPDAVEPEIPLERIVHVPYIRRGREAPLTEADQPKPDAASGTRHREARGLRALWRKLQHLPDPHVTWIGPAVEEGLEMGRTWCPDVIFSTGPPDSSHIAASRIAAKLGTRFVAELRDLWSDNLYHAPRPFIEMIERHMERRALGRADALVAVTAGAAERLRQRYGKPVVQAANGFDPSDFAGLDKVEPLDAGKLAIVHAGSTYGGRRSPAPLFAALAAMGETATGIAVHFYGEDAAVPASIAEEAGVSHLVKTYPPIPRTEVLRVERAADILLLLRFDTPGERHVVAGKLYEYIGARRPVLCHGQTEGEAAEIIRTHELGLVSNDPGEIAGWLSARLAARRSGRLPDLPREAAEAMTRGEQFAKIEALLKQIAAG